ncbi:MAG: alpha/beta fold hydrolase [Deltaproteobacteria bacterium]|nr:alpha/beta fold hydrolase [Deltaproteobacteria bacterium]
MISLDQARRTPGDRRIVETRAGRLGVIVRGSGPDLILIHGITDNADTWRAVQERLAERARVHAIDLPGHGLSDIPARPLTVAEQAAAVVAYLDSAGIARCVVSGNSLGGGVTLGVAHQVPDRVAAAVPICALGTRFPVPFSLGTLRYRPFAELMPVLARRPRVARLFMRDMYNPRFRPSDQEVVDYWSQWLVAGRPQYLRALLRALDVAEPTPWLASIRLPVHVVHGEADRIIPVRVGHAIAAALPNARLTTLPGIGHEPQHECIEETCAILADTLNRVSQP